LEESGWKNFGGRILLAKLSLGYKIKYRHCNISMPVFVFLTPFLMTLGSTVKGFPAGEIGK
jgi:hypothetical protein